MPWKSVASQKIDGLLLKCTCSACPEQYEVFDRERQVAYMRLRHGEFSVSFLDCDGPVIFYGSPIGDGQFDDDERQQYLEEAVCQIKRWDAMNSDDRDRKLRESVGFVRA